MRLGREQWRSALGWILALLFAVALFCPDEGVRHRAVEGIALVKTLMHQK